MLYPFHHMGHEIDGLPRRLGKLASRRDKWAELGKLPWLHAVWLIDLPEEWDPHQPIIEVGPKASANQSARLPCLLRVDPVVL